MNLVALQRFCNGVHGVGQVCQVCLDGYVIGAHAVHAVEGFTHNVLPVSQQNASVGNSTVVLKTQCGY